jgi:hypothetical protein
MSEIFDSKPNEEAEKAEIEKKFEQAKKASAKK